MDSSTLHRAVKAAITQAEHACDPQQNTLMDRTDLQRTIGRLKRILEQVERAYDVVQADKRSYQSASPEAISSPTGRIGPRRIISRLATGWGLNSALDRI